MTTTVPELGALPPEGSTDWYPSYKALHERSAAAWYGQTTLTPEQFGATGDGVTNDQAALARMLAAAKPGDRLLLAPAVAYRKSGLLTLPVPDLTWHQFGQIVSTDPQNAAVQVGPLADRTTMDGLRNRVDWGGATMVRGGTDIRTAPLAVFSNRGSRISRVFTENSAQCGIYHAKVEDYVLVDAAIRRSMADGIHFTHACTDYEVIRPRAIYPGDDGVAAAVSYLTEGQSGPAIGPCRRGIIRDPYVRYTHARGVSIVGGEDITVLNVDVAWTRGAGLYMAAESGYNTHAPVRCVFRGGKVADPGYPIPASGSTTDDAALDHGHLFFLTQQPTTPVTDSGFEDIEVTGGGAPVISFTRSVSNNGATYSGCFYRRIRATTGKELRAGGIGLGGSTAGIAYERFMDLRTTAGATTTSSSLRYREATRTAGNVSVTGATLAAFDTAMDLAVPAAAGDLLEVTLNIQAGDNVAATIDWNVAVVDAAGATIRQLGGQGTQATIGAWSTRGGDFWGMSGDVSTTVQAGDLVSEAVRLRLQVRCSGTRTVFANGTVPAKWWAKNLGTPTP